MFLGTGLRVFSWKLDKVIQLSEFSLCFVINNLHSKWNVDPSCPRETVFMRLKTTNYNMRNAEKTLSDHLSKDMNLSSKYYFLFHYFWILTLQLQPVVVEEKSSIGRGVIGFPQLIANYVYHILEYFAFYTEKSRHKWEKSGKPISFQYNFVILAVFRCIHIFVTEIFSKQAYHKYHPRVRCNLKHYIFVCMYVHCY